MKKSMFFALATLGLVAFASCKKEEEKTPEAAPELTNETQITGIPFTGGEFTYEFDSNKKWTVAGDAEVTIEGQTYEFGLNPTSGDAGHGVVTVTVPANKGAKEISYSFTLTLLGEDKDTKPLTKTVSLTIPAPSVTDAAGNTYKVVYLKDGNYWMAENLRYVPEGLTPSKDLNNVTAGVYYPIKVSDDHTKAVQSSDENDIKAYGYLYQAETAFGLAINSLKTEEEAKRVEGTQGICPKGWHIPTSKDIINLVGKSVSPFTLNDKAPYYDGKNASIKLLNEDSFNIASWGAISIQDNSKTEATLMGWMKNNPDIISSGYIHGSTFAQKYEFPQGGTQTGIKNIQFLGIMPMAGNGTANGAKLSYKIGASVRCVMDKATKE